MDIGEPKPAIIVEPLEDPFQPVPAPEETPARELETESPELVPA